MFSLWETSFVLFSCVSCLFRLCVYILFSPYWVSEKTCSPVFVQHGRLYSTGFVLHSWITETKLRSLFGHVDLFCCQTWIVCRASLTGAWQSHTQHPSSRRRILSPHGSSPFLLPHLSGIVPDFYPAGVLKCEVLSSPLPADSSFTSSPDYVIERLTRERRVEGILGHWGFCLIALLVIFLGSVHWCN